VGGLVGRWWVSGWAGGWVSGWEKRITMLSLLFLKSFNVEPGALKIS